MLYLTQFWCVFKAGGKREHFVYVIYVSRSAFSPPASAVGCALWARPSSEFDVCFPRLRGEFAQRRLEFVDAHVGATTCVCCRANMWGRSWWCIDDRGL